ncbi:MAG: hypothetical protein HY318_01440 [Armatimonadetes bacterium]|nr:hypothetical protein [Armatimonadota bacterium]
MRRQALSRLLPACGLTWGLGHIAFPQPTAQPGSVPVEKAIAPVPGKRSVTVKVGQRGELRVDGKPVLPLFAWLQPIGNFDFLKSLGLNTFMAEGAREGETTQQFLDALQTRKLWGIIHARADNYPLKSHPALLTWMFGDEPDLPLRLSYTSPVKTPKDEQGHSNLWWEAESPQATNFLRENWMNVESDRLSGGHWLSTSANSLPAEGAYQAQYRVEVPATADYHLWVREFGKAWGSPSWWRFDAKEWQHTPRDLKTLESESVGKNLSVGWHPYGAARLTEGTHTFEIKVDESRTLGRPDAVAEQDFLFSFDAFLLTTGDQPPLSPDQPERPRLSPDEIRRQYEAIKEVDATHPVYLNLTSAFYKQFAKYDDDTYRAFCRATDLVGYDMYPVTGWGRPDWVPLIAPVTKKLRELAPLRVPVWAILECSTKLQWVSQDYLDRLGHSKGATATELRAMVWMALLNGAKAIGYFPHRRDPYKQCEISDELQTEMKRTNRQLVDLTPVILGPDTGDSVTVEGIRGGPVEYAVKRAENEVRTYLFLVNSTTHEAETRVRLAKSKALLDLDTNERMPVGAEGVALSFAPLQVRLFVLQ